MPIHFKSRFETGWDDTTEDWVVFKTGEWSVHQPRINMDECRQCGWCALYCPVGCVREKDEGFFDIDLSFCKGCGICAKECPAGAIQMIMADRKE